MAEFAQILIRAKDETKAAFDSAAKNMRGLEAGASRLGGILSSVGIGAGLSVAGLAVFAKSGIDAADGLNDMSQRLGVSVKDLASFKLAAEQSGTSLDGVGAGIARLTRSIGEAEGGNKKLAATLGALGITARDPKEAFFQLADAVKTIEDPSKRAALLSDVLGKSYQDLIPLLSQGGDELRRSAKESESFAEAMAKAAPDADKFNDELERMKTGAAGAAAGLTGAILPTLNQIISQFNAGTAAAGGFWAAAAIGLKYSFDTPGEGLEELGKRFVVLNKQLDIAKEKGNQRTVENLKEERTQILREMKYLNAIKAAQNPVGPDKPKPNGGGGGSNEAQLECVASGGTWDGKRCVKKPTGGGGAKADPLASLYASTDIGKLAAFDKTVAQINARFDGGRKNAELYTQEMTKLVETTFSANFTEFNRQLADQDETQRMVAEHLKATNDEIYAQQQAWAEAGAALTDEMRTPLENANIEFGRLQDLLDRGVISWETYGRAVMKTQDAISETPEKLEEMDGFAKQFAENAQDSFADLFKNFDKGTDGMLRKFGETVKGLVAEAVAADLAKYLFGDAVKGGSGGGVAGSLLSGIGELFGFAKGGIAAYGRPVALPRFAGGGVSNSAAIFGEAGPEAAVPLPDGRRIPVEMRGGGGGHTVNVYVDGSNGAPGVRNAAGQVGRSVLSALEGARRYG